MIFFVVVFRGKLEIFKVKFNGIIINLYCFFGKVLCC